MGARERVPIRKAGATPMFSRLHAARMAREAMRRVREGR